MANVMQSLFGLELDRQQQAPITARQAISGIIERTGESLQQNIAGAFGQQTPRQALNSIVQRTQQEADLSTPEGLIALANNLNQLPQFAGIALAMRQEAAQLAQQSELTRARTFQATAQGMKALQERPENKILPPGAVLVGPGGEIIARGESVTPKGEQPSESLKRYNELIGLGVSQEEARRIAYNIKPVAEEGVKVGFDKTGRYTNQFGEVISSTEMTKNRTGFQAAEDLLSKLNDITATDVKNAESVIDYTQSDTRKAIGGKVAAKTLDAQTKIAASQLLQQIESLPPGSASDADMRSAARAFPGYSDATALVNWINRTKGQLEQSLARQNEQYGFPRRIRSSAPLSFGQTQAPQTAGQPTAQPRATKRYNEATGQLEDIR